MSSTAPTPAPVPQPCHIVVVLDRSGSMNEGTKRAETIGGFNAFLADQKKEPGEATITLVQFNDKVETVYAAQPLATAPELTEKTFVPRGNTALRDAVGQALIEAKEYVATFQPDKQPRVIVVIVTDGAENHSVECSPELVKRLMAEARTMGWGFIFTATSEEAIDWAGTMGMPSGSTQQTTNTGAGMSSGMRSSSRYTSQFRGRPRTNNN